MIIFDNADITKMKNEENRTNLKSVTIEGLFGRKDITLNFEKTVNIYVGENGLGKTTILNCVYYILKGDYEKLLNISFERIIVRLSSLSSHRKKALEVSTKMIKHGIIKVQGKRQNTRKKLALWRTSCINSREKSRYHSRISISHWGCK